jgi:hypothetical protein
VLHRIDLPKSLSYPRVRIVVRNVVLRQDIASLVIFTRLNNFLNINVGVVSQVLLFVGIVFTHFLAFARLDFVQIIDGLDGNRQFGFGSDFHCFIIFATF